ncbi:NADH-ubiquinone oxidoreductase-F iron-sulfur binding region domain-containing protein [Actinospica acidithermotolerans]|nr:NADH-ubiquinone oxidoreductase-F iron-sulfur binding region domain-containing protein [Actinospica acidithermotolerans]
MTMTSTADDARPTAADTAPNAPRLLLGHGRALTEHVSAHGPLPALTGPEIIARTEQAGLTGRGGAAFPTGRKLAAVARGAGRKGTVVVANGCEGEPASAKDRTLILNAPHLVLDGVQLAARAVGARQAHLCVHEDEHDIRNTLTAALAERATALPAEAPITLTLVPHRYVASEESALVRALNGGPSLPAHTPPRPFERGVGGRPTLVDNVETLAHLALIARHGSAWFRARGTATAPGTTLVTIGGAVRNPGVYEIPLGITGADLLALAGGAGAPLQAMLCGGYFGSWLPADTFAGTEISAPGLAAAGSAIGAGVFVALPRTSCALAETAKIAAYLAGQSARQCGPCLHGLPALAKALRELAASGGTRPAHNLQALMPYIERRGACRHPDGATRLIASALRAFPEEVRAHADRKRCPAVHRAEQRDPHQGRRYGT